MMRIATRASTLARWQAEHVAASLRDNGVDTVELVLVETSGDADTTTPLHVIGGRGVFCKEVQLAVLDGRADIAVHSAKDLPAITPAGLKLAAIPRRGECRDALVGSTLHGLRPGAHIATGSVRRRAQLAKLRPDLQFHELRGNIETRLRKARDFDAIVMAATALDRLGIVPDMPVDVVPIETMVPQVGQGALAVECRSDDAATEAILAALEDPVTGAMVRAERAFLRELGGDCSLPAAAHARGKPDGSLSMVGFLASERHDRTLQLKLEGSNGEELGRELATTLRTSLES